MLMVPVRAGDRMRMYFDGVEMDSQPKSQVRVCCTQFGCIGVNCLNDLSQFSIALRPVACLDWQSASIWTR